MAVRTGVQFLEGLRDAREIWLEGERVDDVTVHPKLKRMASTLASVYDLQNDPEVRPQMTFTSPKTGQPIAMSYLIPETQDDLIRRRNALEIIAQTSHGMLGRTPDYVNIQVTGARQMAEVYGENDRQFSNNIIAYYEYIRDNDLCLTHAFGHPQVNRAVPLTDLPDPYIPLGVVDTTSRGLIVSGAKLLATLAPFADEIFAPIYRPLPLNDPASEKYAIGFALPVATPGLKFICRESYDLGFSLYDYPLSGQYDEIDALAVFENVLIPWDRVFAYGDVELGNRNLGRVPLFRQYMQQVAVKNIAKLEFVLGVTHAISEAIGITRYGHVQEKISEIIDTLEMVRAFMRAAEADAAPLEDGIGLWPAADPWTAMRHWWPDAYTRVMWIVSQLSASGLMLTPTEQDVTGPISEAISKYYQGTTIGGSERIRLFRLAWDLVGTQFGSRQSLYERFANGDVTQLRMRRFSTYDYTNAKQSLKSFFEALE